MYYVYGHFVGNNCLYVGCGNKKRPWDFASRSPRWKARFFQDAPHVKIFAQFESKAEAYAKERILIEDLRLKGMAVLNQDNAKYWLGKKFTAEHKQKISRTNEKHHNFGKKASAELRQKLSASHKGIEYGPMSQEHKAKISAARKASNAVKASGEKIWETRRANGTASGWKSSKAKAVRCIESRTIYRSAKEAALATNSNPKHIQACCIGRRTTTNKLRWEYIVE